MDVSILSEAPGSSRLSVYYTSHMTDAPPTSSLRFATHGHHRLSYELIPADHAPTETVVLLHALLAGRCEFAALRTLLSDRFNLLLPDARGHGASAAIPDQRYTIQTAASELDAILDAAGESRVHLLGHGLGGAVAIAYASVRARRVLTLTLIDPAVPNLLAGDPDSTVAAYDDARRADDLAADTAYKGITERAVDQYLAPRSGPDWRATASRPMVGAIRRHASALAGSLVALSNFTPDAQKLGALTLPTIIFTTATARPVTRFANQRLARLMPESRLVDLPAGSPDDPLRSPLSGAAASALAGFLLDRSEHS
jgi:pimeloyl-ACP methyl ester carboxylesterase